MMLGAWNRGTGLASTFVVRSSFHCGRSVIDAAARNAHAMINPTGSCTFSVVVSEPNAGHVYLLQALPYTGHAEW